MPDSSAGTKEFYFAFNIAIWSNIGADFAQRELFHVEQSRLIGFVWTKIVPRGTQAPNHKRD
jgi:hypothetical protein